MHTPKIEALIQQFLLVMNDTSQPFDDNPLCEPLLVLAKNVDKDEPGANALATLAEALHMQLCREREEMHILGHVAREIWDQACKAGQDYLDVCVQKAASQPGEKPFEQRGKALMTALGALGIEVKYGQALTALARCEGFGSYPALQARLRSKPAQPAYCPHCGAAGTLQFKDKVCRRIEETTANTPDNQEPADQYECTRCHRTFVNL